MGFINTAGAERLAAPQSRGTEMAWLSVVKVPGRIPTPYGWGKHEDVKGINFLLALPDWAVEEIFESEECGYILPGYRPNDAEEGRC